MPRTWLGRRKTPIHSTMRSRQIPGSAGMQDGQGERRTLGAMPNNNRPTGHSRLEITVSEVIRVVTNKPCPLWAPNAKLDLHAVGDRCLKCEGEKFIVEYHDAQTAYDAAQSELAALREDLAKYKGGCVDLSSQVRELEHKMDYWEGSNKDLQQRLAAAEQRNAELVELLIEHQWEWEQYDSHSHREGGYYCVECQEPKDSGHEADCKLAAALKPTESGASES